MSKLNWSGYAKLMRMDKPIGTYLLLWPTLWALLIAAQGMPSWDLLLVFSAGVFVMRSAGCVINDYADRHVDGSVARTASRPLATGEVTEKEALFLFAFLISIALGLVLMLNWQTVLLSLGALLLATIYPFMKRFTHLPQVVLGAALLGLLVRVVGADKFATSRFVYGCSNPGCKRHFVFPASIAWAVCIASSTYQLSNQLLSPDAAQDATRTHQELVFHCQIFPHNFGDFFEG